MAKPLDENIKKIIKECGIDYKQALWDCHGTWVMYHRYIEQAGAKKGVVIDDLVEVETNSAAGIVCIKCYAHLGKQKVITYGESSPKNTKNSYPYSMAEKRGIDRAILKLIGLHGHIMSDEEMDNSYQKIGSSDDTALETFQQNIEKSKTMKELNAYYGMAKVEMAKAKQSSPATYQVTVSKYNNKLKELKDV